MGFEISEVPNDISVSAAPTWGLLKSDLGANFDTLDANGVILEASAQLQALCVFGPSVLPGTPETFLTGAGTSTWTLAAGTVACIPKGSFGAYSGAVVVKTPSDLMQGCTADATNYVWLRLLSDGTCDLVVNGSSSPPANCLLLGRASGGGTIGTIIQAPVFSRAMHRPCALTFGAFTASATVMSNEIIPMTPDYLAVVKEISYIWNTANGADPSDADGTMTFQVYKRLAAGTEVALLAAPASVEGPVLTTGNSALISTTADLVFAKGDCLYAKATNDSAAIDNNTTNLTVLVHLSDGSDKYY